MDQIYEERIVAFLDILAFSQLIARMDRDPVLHKRVLAALEAINSHRQNIEGDKYAKRPLKVSVFSDSIVISGEGNQIFEVLHESSRLQVKLLNLGILMRGGVSIGRTVHQGDILYGPGLIKAYYLESRTAIYPRILVDPELVDMFGFAKHRIAGSSVIKDHDGLWFVDPFSQGMVTVDDMYSLEAGWQPNEVALEFLGSLINTEIAKTKEANHLMKWNWLERQRKNALDFCREFGRPRFYQAILDEQGVGGQPATPPRVGD